MAYELDPLSPTGLRKKANQGFTPYFAGGPGKPSLVDKVNGKTGDVQLNLDDLTDVELGTPADNQALAYDSATSKFIPQSIASLAGGDVTGPASSTDNAIARFDGTTGKVVQNSTVTIGDDGATVITPASNSDGLTVTNPGTGSGITVTQGGVLAGSDYGLDVSSSAAQTANYLARIRNSSTSTSVRTMLVETLGTSYALSARNSGTSSGGAMEVINSSTGNTLFVDDNSNSIGIFVDKDVTNTNNSTEGLFIENRSVVNDGNTYTKSGAALRIDGAVTETSGTITDSAIVLDINQTHADATGNVVDIDNDGTGNAFYIQQDGTLAANKAAGQYQINSDLAAATRYGLLVATNTAHTSGRLFQVTDDNASSTLSTVVHIQSDGVPSNGALFIDNNNTGRSINIDHDASSASSITGQVIDVDNASTGGAIGLDISNVTATSGTVIGQRIAAPSGGTSNYALQLSDTAGTAAGGITFGTDTNLYRSAADTLKTDDNLIVGTAGTAAGSAATIDGTQTLTNKRITARVFSTASSTTPTPNADSYDQYQLTALAGNATFGAPSGTPTSAQKLMIRIKDDGTARTLTWNAIYRAIGVTLPATTVISKTLYLACIYNGSDTKWDVLAVGQEA